MKLIRENILVVLDGLVENNNAEYTDKIKITNLPSIIYYTGASQYDTAKYALYNIAGSFLHSEYNTEDRNSFNAWEQEIINFNEILSEYPSAAFIRFGSYQKTLVLEANSVIDIESLYRTVQSYQLDSTISTKVNSMLPGNILYGKKYVACGDSFTEGDFTSFVDSEGHTGKNSSYLYDSDWKMYKTYPYWIAKRNNMTLINEAKCGSTLPLSKEYTIDQTQPITYRNPFSLNRYQAVPKDADYITLMFGLNEGSIPIGTLTDTDNTTVLGAYNVVLEYLITEIPAAKIGIIISDAWLSQNLHDAIISVAKYWGIPYLDLKGDDSVPLQIGGRLNNINLNNTAKTIRDTQYKVSSTNGHPNILAHQQRSTVIENFLRSL